MATTNEKVAEPAEKPMHFTLFRLIVDQARVDDHVLNYPYEGTGTEEDPFEVTWIPHDAGNPYHWKRRFRWLICGVVAIECFAAAFSSSAYSGKYLPAHS